MMDVLSGALSGSGILDEVSGPYQAERRSRCGHMFLALNIAAFGPEDAFAERMERMVEQLKAVPRAPGCEEVFYPGEIEARNEDRYRREGLSLPQQTFADLAQAARQSNVALPNGWSSGLT
jgi:LDH2 family malate/lactate/ureidoglycolate dehydrogenase